MSSIGTHRTTIQTSPDGFEVRYHDTVIFSCYGNLIKLDTGGYFTATTKRRMNQALDQVARGCMVFQSKGAWYVNTPSGKVPFTGNVASFAVPGREVVQ